MEQQVDAIADSANKVISGVVDSSFGILRSFMPNGAPPQAAGSASSGRTTPGTPGPSRAGFGLLRRESGFSIASLAASLPIAGRSRSAAGNAEEAGQQMISVSKPASLKSNRSSLKIRMGGGGGEEQENASDDDDGDDEESVSSDEESEEGGSNVQDAAESGKNLSREVRSIRSFESMLSVSREKKKGLGAPRKSLSDRLASMSALAASSIKVSCFLLLVGCLIVIIIILSLHSPRDHHRLTHGGRRHSFRTKDRNRFLAQYLLGLPHLLRFYHLSCSLLLQSSGS